jgi:hypothetical protein
VYNFNTVNNITNVEVGLFNLSVTTGGFSYFSSSSQGSLIYVYSQVSIM